MLRSFQVVVVVVAGVALILAAEPALKTFAFRDVVVAKRGQVIDAATGRGLAGVTVTVNWTSGGGGVAGSFGGCDLQRVVTTDANGEYSIPNVVGKREFQRVWWKQLAAPLLGLTPPYIGYSWTLVPWKAGYVRMGDEDKIKNAVQADHQPDRSLPFYWNPPPYHSELIALHIDPIYLSAEKLEPIDEIVYDDALLLRASCSGYPEVREAMKAEARALPCVIPGDTALMPGVIRAFAHLVGDENFFDRMRSMTGTELWSRRSQLASTVCRAIEAGQ